MQTSESTVLGGTWGLPFVGLAATVAAILIAFVRIGTEPIWKTALVSVWDSVIVVAVGLLLLKVATREGR